MSLSLVFVAFCFRSSVSTLVLVYAICRFLVISLCVDVLAWVCAVVSVWWYSVIVLVILDIVTCPPWFLLVCVVVFWILGFVISYWVLFNYVGICLSGYLAVSLVSCWGGFLGL